MSGSGRKSGKEKDRTSRRDERDEKEKEEKEKEREKREEKEKRRESRHMSILGSSDRKDEEVKSPQSRSSGEGKTTSRKKSRTLTETDENKIDRKEKANVSEEELKSAPNEQKDLIDDHLRDDGKQDTSKLSKSDKPERKSHQMEGNRSLRLSEITSLQEAAHESNKASPRIRSLDLALGKRYLIFS